jgi:signal transduction histidine kinase/CheY-like chemotaxis protein
MIIKSKMTFRSDTNYYGKEMLQAFAKVTTNHSMLINREGYWLKSPNPADEWGFMFKRPDLSMVARSPAAWKAITSSESGQVMQDDGLWTWETIFPILIGQKASTGNPDAAGFSFKELDSRQYFWKAVSHYSTDSLSAIQMEIWLKVGGVLSLLLGLSGLGCWILAKNIAAQKIAEAKLIESRQEAMAATAAKSQFLATMSHEVRTPLNGILGMAQLLVKSQLQDDRRMQYAKTILDSGHTLLSLLNDILDLSKVEAGKLNLELIVFAVEPVVVDTCALFAETAHAKGLQLESAWQGPAGPCYVGDSHRLRQMLSNLISNAIKFTASGFVRVLACEIERQSQYAVLLFSVSDSGIGITHEQQARLFQPFSQADSSTTRQFGGSGLGLSIVSRLAQLMGGEVGIDSEPGQGARFWFRVRVLLQTGALESYQIVASPVLVPVKDLSGTVLIVDDHPVNRMVIMAMLGDLGCSGLTVTVVEDGQQALDFITQGGVPDLVLMDVQMPVMGGLESTEKIRLWEADHGKPRTTIVALTANAFKEDRQKCLAAGMDDFLVKPIDMEKLQATLVRWL